MIFALPGFTFSNEGFTGFVDLEAGQPDPETGRATIDVTGASAYLVLDLNPGAAFTLCLRPLDLPVRRAGVIDCDGGSNLAVAARIDHVVGVVGVGGFTGTDCAAAGGAVEAADGVHPGSCNGPLTVDAADVADSGLGAVKLGFDEVAGFAGLPVELTVEEALPCGDEGGGVLTSLGLVSGLSRATISNSDAVPGSVLSYDQRGEAFSCREWSREDGPGRLVVALPALHGFLGSDLITAFVLDD